MKKLLIALVTGMFALTATAPVFAADEKKMEKKDEKKKDEKKKDEKKKGEEKK